MTIFKRIATGITLVAVIISLYAMYAIMQLYSLDDKQLTATSGIIFTRTLHLNEYKKVSCGNNLLGSYDRYSRSDRHNEVITVYKW